MNHSQTRREDARNVRVDAFVAQMHSTERAAIAAAIEQHNVAELERAAIAGRIKQARKEAGLSQPEMADAVGVIPRTYQNYEATSNPRTPWGLMNQIATITGKTTEWLIHGDRETPDLFPVTEQLDGVSVQFAGRVDAVEAQLDEIRGMLYELLVHFGLRQPDEDAARTLQIATSALAEQARADLPSATAPAPADHPARTRSRAKR